MKYLKTIKNVALLAFLSYSVFIFAQTDYDNSPIDDNAKIDQKSINDQFQEELTPFYLHGSAKSMHLWRGIAVTNSTTLVIDAGITTKDKKLKLGLWGGYGTNGVYREFDYYVVYSPIKNLDIALWDIYNYSTNATWTNDKFFEYDARKTGRFMDLSINYKISDKFPLKLYWSTVIHGRDRGVRNEKNLYSSYAQASYPVLNKKKVNVSLYAGAAFALSPEEGERGRNFLGPKSGIADVGFIIGNTLNLGRYQLPISATFSWSPINNAGNVQLAFDVF